MNGRAMWAIFKRDFSSYFSSPLGYVFVLFFVLLTALGQFRLDDTFFVTNRANLDLLTQVFPLILVLFVPAITMAAWAEEYKQGTDELLFTLPARDLEVVLAKYGACLGIFSVALLFTLSHVGVLAYLGDPDLRLIGATYLGYWLLGATLIAVAMLGSALTSNLTVGFILGVVFCGALVSLDDLIRLLPWRTEGYAAALSTTRHFQTLSRGVLSLEGLVSLVAMLGCALYGNSVLVGRRRWRRGAGMPLHGALRIASLLVGGLSLAVLSAHAAARVDVTREKMLSLSPESRAVLEGIDPRQPVLVQVWVSPEVPPDYLQVKEGILRLLEEYDAFAGERLTVAVYPTELYSDAAEKAQSTFGITPQKVFTRQDGREGEAEVFLGLAFTCGPREEVIPFFSKGLPIQYELTRAVGVVAQVQRAKVGVLKTDANLQGSFDWQSMRRSDEWRIVEELRRQYTVVDVDGAAAIDTSLDVLLVPMPSSLPQEKLTRVEEYLFQGGKALLLCDPHPLFNLTLSPLQPSGGPRNPFQPAPPSPPKGDIDGLMHALGLHWPKDRVVWDDYNPHPEFQQFPRELVFAVGEREGQPSGFEESDPITAGLQEVVLLFPGELELRDVPEVKTSPLVWTRTQSGTHTWSEMVEAGMFGLQMLPEGGRRYESEGRRRLLAARVEGRLTAPADGEGMTKGQLSERPFRAVVVADMDLVGDGLYDLRRQGHQVFDLDNVTFVSNCLDDLAGERDYLELRKRRSKQRTLTRLEGIEDELRERQRDAAKSAREAAERELDEARKRLDSAVQAIEGRQDLDDRTKGVQVRYVRDREQRIFDAAQQRIENQEKQTVDQAKREVNRELKAVQTRLRLWAILLPPVPALLLGLLIFATRVRQEREGISPARRK